MPAWTTDQKKQYLYNQLVAAFNANQFTSTTKWYGELKSLDPKFSINMDEINSGSYTKRYVSGNGYGDKNIPINLTRDPYNMIGRTSTAASRQIPRTGGTSRRPPQPWGWDRTPFNPKKDLMEQRSTRWTCPTGKNCQRTQTKGRKTYTRKKPAAARPCGCRRR